jgi:hypothetical protein
LQQLFAIKHQSFIEKLNVAEPVGHAHSAHILMAHYAHNNKRGKVKRKLLVDAEHD